MNKPLLSVITGSGISKESGISTFSENSLWCGHKIQDVASIDAWTKNPQKVLNFYNELRNKIFHAKPNDAHISLVELEQRFDVRILTQNIDNLHVKAGSKNIIYLHGDITKAVSTKDPNLVYSIKGEKMSIGDKCQLGSQLRPYVTWFGEIIPMRIINQAVETISRSNIVIIVGTSLSVDPVAQLIDYIGDKTPIFCIDPNVKSIKNKKAIITNEVATKGLPKVVKSILKYVRIE